MTDASPRPLSAKKLLDSKWTACHPVDKEKHYVVTRVFKTTRKANESEASGHTSDPNSELTSDPSSDPNSELELELEAVLTKKRRILPWRELKNPDAWRPGWN